MGSGHAAVMALKAGADIIMATGSHEEQVETFESLYQAVESGELSKKRINESVERVLMQKLKHDLFENRFVDPEKAKEIAAQPDFQEKAAEVARQSITLVKNDNVLPFDKHTEQNIFVAGVTEVDSVASAVQNISEANVTSWQASSHTPKEEEVQEAAALAENADKIIVATYSKSGLPDEQAQLVKELQDTGKPVVAVSLGLPYDVAEYPKVDGYLTSYAIDKWGSDNPTVLPALKASVDVIFGAQPGGKLPVTIEDLYPYGHGLSYK
ncbi:glycoside hydrolase family 3 C-terminal domain-containing protein [Halobacillus shinanisalinarum]|uniref:beta-N-acetylhexosaminidase n=1 Tax=Halobacillus shinanisalinarum TaxID=2932258 RepID=A0ABY4GXW7_9BACI|nr:glycoside hydrolase family 3 protein [Halobacillus shinanisalinarum]UOQ92267.1 glycoside hydrolase family 3 C-terminal domain-containing protein [Halobacillus shinanisalinarum]